MDHALAPYLVPPVKRMESLEGVLQSVSRLSVDRLHELAQPAFEVFRLGAARAGCSVRDEGQAVRLVVERRESGFLPQDATQHAREQSYCLELRPEAIVLQAEHSAGFRCGFATLVQVLEILRGGFSVPAVRILDWPRTAYRGIFMEDKWGPDLMELSDWKDVVDYLGALKMNVLGVGIYGCWCVQYDGQVTEFLMTPLPYYPQLKTEKTIRWYSPAER